MISHNVYLLDFFAQIFAVTFCMKTLILQSKMKIIWGKLTEREVTVIVPYAYSFFQCQISPTG